MPLPRDVKALGLVSLLNDASSEMIYPLLPAFVVGPLRAGPVFLGWLEGAAESLASVLKLASGALSDRLERRKPLVVGGYALAAVVRPWIALALTPWHVAVVRLVDRVGKGLRSAPRDALLAGLAPAEERGRAFGFHRAMDHAGAALGPLLAAGALACGADLRLVFALAALPAGLALLVLVFGVREAAPRPSRATQEQARSGQPLSSAFKAYLAVLALFTLGASSDAFLLLRAQEAGVSLAALPLLWSFHHVLKSATGAWGGALSDRLGRRRVIVAGWALYAAAYLGFALAEQAWHAWASFAVYALHFSLCEGAEKALVVDLAGDAPGRAFGLFHGLTGALLLPASVLTGVLWQAHGARVALGVGATLALAASCALWVCVPEPHSGAARA